MAIANQAFWWLLIPTTLVLFLVIGGFIIEFCIWHRGWLRRLHKLEAGRRAQRDDGKTNT